MTQPQKISRIAFFVATLLLLPLRVAAQQGTVTDEGLVSSNANTQQLNLNGNGLVLIVAGSSATVGTTPVGLTKSYIKFQLTSSLPPNTTAANVVKATLKLFISPSCNATGAIDVFPITSAWTESTLSAASPPSYNSTPINTSPIPVGKAESFLVIDLTEQVQDWLEDPSVSGSFVNQGIALVPSTLTTYVVFDSRKNIVTSEAPRLEIVLANSGPAGQAATVQVGSTSTLGPNGQASVTNTGTSSAAILNFTIPQGQPGAPGQPGPAATVAVGTVMPVPSNAAPAVMNGGTANAAVLNFLIPQGQPGPPGQQGPVGINNKGPWSSATAYGPNDAVFDSAAYWLATAANTNSEPSPANKSWQLLAGGIVNRGVWNAANSYNVNDAVSDQGSSWLALAASNNSEPSSTNTNWQLLAAKGDTGQQGGTGSQGPKGDQGVQGVMGLQGPMPVGAAITTTANTFTTSQTINGSLILSGPAGAIQFADGTSQTTAATSGGASGGTISCSTFEISSASPVAPSGYTPLSQITAGNLWFAMAPMPTARYSLAAAADVQGNLYAIGGFDSSNAIVGTVEKYNPATNTWSTVASMPTARAALAAAADAQGNLYAIGGLNSIGFPVGTVEKYDPRTNTWTTVANMPTARGNLAAAADAQGNLYAIGGLLGPLVGTAVENGPLVYTVEKYDPRTNTWTTVANMPTARGNLAAAADAQGNLYAIGGVITSVFGLGTVEKYNPATDSWSTVASMPTIRGYLGAAADAQGNLYAIGGLNSSVVEKYNPATDSWSTVASMPTIRAYLGAAADAQGNLYAIGGLNSIGFPVGTVEKYTPAVTIYTFIKN